VDRLIYTSLTAMRGAMARQTSVANNLANVQTPGFRADVAEAQALWLNGQTFETRALASEEVVNADMRAGTVMQTGRQLDIAIENDTLLAVQSAEGEESYTRRGDLQLSDSGLLTTGDGRPVMGAQGPITLPPVDSISIDPEGRIQIVPVGGDPNLPQEVDRLKLVSPTGLDVVKGMDGLFRVRGGGVLPPDPAGRVQSGHLEGSNVQSTQALVEMIEASRAWDAQLKLIGNAQDMDAATADLMRLSE
jgi:flagellar basal-body rod protein FlgF